MSPSPTNRPTSKQLAYLKALAARTATSFVYPNSAAQASREIHRLRQLPPLSAAEDATARDLDNDREHPAYGTAPAADEITGYGSTATWR